MESSKPFVAWKLISHAAILSQDAGYHRLPDQSANGDDKYKRIAFWYLYAAEKGFCFNIGRSSVFQDYDITTVRPSCPGDLEAPWGAFYLRWLDLARLQGEIYQQLFSGGARYTSTEVRAQRARILVQKLWTIYDPSLFVRAELEARPCRFPIAGNDEPDKEFENYQSAASNPVSIESLNTFKLLFYSVLTLVCRIISPQPKTHPLQSTDECKSAACTVLNIYNQTWGLITENGTEFGIKFVHWYVGLGLLSSELANRFDRTILFCPFVSYLVVFGAVIVESSHEYLRILENTSRILHSAAEFSPEMEKLDHACGRFYQAAKTYLELPVQSSHPDSESQNLCHDFVGTAEQSEPQQPLGSTE